MNRDYDSGTTDTAEMFVGQEVEHTPAFGMRTLFVVGIQETAKVHAAAMAYDCDHIYFGANQSFPRLAVNDSAGWRDWEYMITTMLNSGKNKSSRYLCTLDVDVSCVEGLVESGLSEYHNFIPMISVKLPYVQLLGYNATIKLDDRDFNATNPGVWCHSLHSLQDRSKFTNWLKYTQDTIIE